MEDEGGKDSTPAIEQFLPWRGCRPVRGTVVTATHDLLDAPCIPLIGFAIVRGLLLQHKKSSAKSSS
jgi:hypothetical protein